jgi:hypothetical protein
MVFAHHRHVAGVLRAVAAATCAVVIGGVGTETGAGVVGIAFAGFFFGSGFFGDQFFGFGFFGREGFGFFSGPALDFFGVYLSLAATSHDLTVMTTSGGPRLLSHLRTVNRGAMELGLLQASLQASPVARFFAFPTATQKDRGSDENQCQLAHGLRAYVSTKKPACSDLHPVDGGRQVLQRGGGAGGQGLGEDLAGVAGVDYAVVPEAGGRVEGAALVLVLLA